MTTASKKESTKRKQKGFAAPHHAQVYGSARHHPSASSHYPYQGFYHHQTSEYRYSHPHHKRHAYPPPPSTHSTSHNTDAAGAPSPSIEYRAVSPYVTATTTATATKELQQPPLRQQQRQHRVDEEPEEFVQQIIVDWTLELDDRLQRWVQYYGEDWNAVGHYMQLPAFICQHRYDTLRCATQTQLTRYATSTKSSSSTAIVPALVRNKLWSTGTNHLEEEPPSAFLPTSKIAVPKTTRQEKSRLSSSTSVDSTKIVSRSNSSDTEDSKKRKRSRVVSSASSSTFLAMRTSKKTKHQDDVIDVAVPLTDSRQESHLITKADKSKKVADAQDPSTAGSRTVSPQDVHKNFGRAAHDETPIPKAPSVQEPVSFFRLFRQGSKACLGFLTLPIDATFADAREQIAEELDVQGDFQFLLDELGPVSRKQERKLGPIKEWLATDDTVAGNRKSPIKLEIVAR